MKNLKYLWARDGILGKNFGGKVSCRIYHWNAPPEKSLKQAILAYGASCVRLDGPDTSGKIHSYFCYTHHQYMNSEHMVLTGDKSAYPHRSLQIQ